VGFSSYPGPTTEAKDLTRVCSLDMDIEGRHVLVVDDILDTGRTLRRVVGDLRRMKPASLRTCVLLRKPGKTEGDIEPDLVGFDIEDVFVVGYGLDYDDQYRNWPDLVVLKPELYGASPAAGSRAH
jgi:hypoxanthine phosphoribosyltransferase